MSWGLKPPGLLHQRPLPGVDPHCEECMEWPEEEVRLYAKYRKSLKSKNTSKSKPSAPPPPANSVPSSQPSPRGDIQSQVHSLNVTVTSLAETLTTRLDALTASLLTPLVTQLSSQARLGPDVGEPQPGVTVGTRRTFQALGVPDGTPAVPPTAYHPLGQGVRAPAMEQLGSAAAPQPQAALGATLPPSATSAPLPPPPRYGDPPPQPSTSGWVPSGPPPTCSARDSRTSSELEASDAESDVFIRDSASSRLTDLIYEVCPVSHPVSDAACQQRCRFEAWFGQPESTASRQRFRFYPRVAEVAARSEALARWSKPLSHIIPTHSRRYSVADDSLFASSLLVNPSFVQLAGARTVGLKRWRSISFSEMERLFRSQLEMTSSSLWLMSGILAMLKHDGFQPSDPALFNAALSSVSASLSQQACSALAGASFIRAKRRKSGLTHISIPVPEAHRRSLTVAPVSIVGLFNEDILSEVVAQVQRSLLISSNLAVSRLLGRVKSRPSSTSPLVDPSSSGPPRPGHPYGKRSVSSSRSGGRKRFRGGKGSAPSSKLSGFRK